MAAVRLILVALALCITAGSHAHALRLASWNMEHLAHSDGEGCRPRKAADYLALKRQADLLNADIIAVQEMENEGALARVFDPELWSFEVARNPDQETPRPCSGITDKTIITQRAGFVIKKAIKYSRNPDLTALDVGNANRHRYGVDITLEAGAPLRLLSVHVKSWCPMDAPGAGDDCEVLFEQQKILKKWVEGRARNALPFVLLGDFNRRLQAEEQFWTAIDAPGDPLMDLTLTVKRDTVARCQPSFNQFIDYIALNPGSLPLLKPDSFQELVYGAGTTPASDRCPITIELNIPDLADLAPEKGMISPGLKWYRRSAEFPLITRFIYDQAMRHVDAIRAATSDASN
ncbi:endonuclease/exonuclease/phosphatase family protein [Bradyrhizobium yuanmingense]|uniref:endonuclease/exonuclease/phosphatase family protein n=1 Tax=Bradyrhizobium yuanmingense TaxID=108015 RepID=UPI0021A7D7A8|nr:endonuclease/exonuclease/phosphatase family protein [Bradyrhizobium sp. CB1024]UWU82993.1 endonuclease/exonuclease/phosphatase family protein [Bradyrhizobium sp. CB1024]